MTASRSRTWAIGVDAWIICDRNYDDFAVGQECVFAVELIPHQISRSDGVERPKASVIQGAVHEFVGRVVHQVGDAWVVDIGLLVYGHNDLLEGTASVGDAGLINSEDNTKRGLAAIASARAAGGDAS
jgi:hypothetical protein